MSKTAGTDDVIFLLGHAKSGTTAIGSLLSQATGEAITVDLFRELNLGDARLRELFARTWSMADFVETHSKHFETRLNKCPKLTFFYPELKSCFPGSTFALIVRDPRDTIRSFLNRRGIPGHLSEFESTRIASRLAGYPFLPFPHYIQRLAHRWRLAANVYLNHPNDVVLIRYEDFLDNKSSYIAELAERLGLRNVHDISLKVDEQYTRAGDHRITWQEFFGERNLSLIERICRLDIESLGYPIRTSERAA